MSTRRLLLSGLLRLLLAFAPFVAGFALTDSPVVTFLLVALAAPVMVVLIAPLLEQARRDRD